MKKAARGLVAILATAAFLEHAALAAPQLWFAPGDDLPVNGLVKHPDFPSLFASPPPWSTGLAQVQVLQLRPPWFARMPDTEVAHVTGFLAARGIALATNMSAMISEDCGQGMEGIAPARQVRFYLRAMQRKSVHVEFAVLDEPLYYGHDADRPGACRLPIPEVAARVADGVAILRAFYPSAKVVLVEPEQSLPGGADELANFLDEYRHATGAYPASVRLDVAWQRDWRTELPPFLAMLRVRRIGYGVIFNATQGGRASSDAEWVASARANAAAFKDAIGDVPSDVVIQTWDARPTQLVPESDPTTMTGFLKWYVTHPR